MKPWATTLLMLVPFVCACAPVAPAPSSVARPQQAAINESRTLSIVMRAEPNDMLTGFVDRSAIHKPLFTATLANWDLQERPSPVLGESVPVLNSETWRVFPDGRMETTYRLKPNLLWHDGTPLVAEDFVFAWRVFATPAFGWSGTIPISSMAEVVAPDPRAVTIRWLVRGA